MSKFDDALNRMKGWLTSPGAKNEGTFSIFNIRAVAQEVAMMRNDTEIIFSNYTLKGAKGQYLDDKAEDYGMTRHYAENATGEVTFSGIDGTTVPGGTTVQAADYGVSFVTWNNVTIASGTATVGASCTTSGPAGNVGVGTVTTIPTQIQGVTSVTNVEAFSGGVDQEDDESFLYRIEQKIRYPATSGNRYHYQQWATSINGVGACDVIGLWDKDNGYNGAGTVKVSILDANLDAADEELIEEVKNYIDPDDGHGGGQAPIGAVVTVSTATEVPISVTATVELGATASDIETVKAAFAERLADSFHEKAENYFQEDDTIGTDEAVDSVSVAIIGRELLDTPGVIDYANLTVNNGTASVPLYREQIFTVGTITLTKAP